MPDIPSFIECNEATLMDEQRNCCAKAIASGASAGPQQRRVYVISTKAAGEWVLRGWIPIFKKVKMAWLDRSQLSSWPEADALEELVLLGGIRHTSGCHKGFKGLHLHIDDHHHHQNHNNNHNQVMQAL